MSRRVCSVCDGGCTAPAGIGIRGVGWAEGEGSARCTCFQCGEPVCGNCSRRVKRTLSPKFGFRKRIRVCNACLEDDRDRKARAKAAVGRNDSLIQRSNKVATHVYTMKKNAVRAAKKAGLTTENVRPVDGGFVVEASATKKKGPKAPRAKADYPREGSKNAKLLDMLTRDGGATEAQLVSSLGWKAPTVRTAIQRVTRAYGLEWRHVKGQDGAKSRWEASKAA